MFKKKKKTSEFSTYRKSGGLWQWVMAGVVMVLFAVIVGFAYMQKDALEIGETPLIVAQNTPIKTRAENPGGIDIPDQDKQVFDLLERVDTNKDDLQKEKKSYNLQKIISDIAIANRTEIVKETKKQEVTTGIKQPVYFKKKPYSGPWGVQLASFTSLNDARNGLAKFRTDHYSVLGKLKSDLQRANVHGKPYYRSQFLGLETKKEAIEICKYLKNHNQECLVIKR